MDIQWSEKMKAPFANTGKEIDVVAAIVDGEPSNGGTARFLLYQTPDATKLVPTMWILYDATTQTQHFLYGEGWEGAQVAGATRIEQALSEEG